jgi:hypothetical protein
MLSFLIGSSILLIMLAGMALATQLQCSNCLG